MLTVTRAIDLFLGDCARRGYSKRTQDTYGRLLDKFADSLPADTNVTELTTDHVRQHLDEWRHKAAGTRAHAFSVMASFCKWLYLNEKIRRNPIDRLERPRRIPAEDLDVTTVSADDVRALLAEAKSWTEKLSVAIPAYMGARRRAAALLRLSDYDRKRERMRFQEKGGKVIWKPVPVELAQTIEAAIAAGAIVEPDDYLIPPERATQSGRHDRDDRVVWRAVNDVAKRAGIAAHVHALRAAFAVFYLEQHPEDIEGLRALLGHRSLATTQVYLRKLDRGTAMERVKTLSWQEEPIRKINSPFEETIDEPDNVYFISAGDIQCDGTPIKIGYAGDPLRRMRHLQDSHSEKLKLIASIPGTRREEALIHRHFAHLRIRGEWFRTDPELREFVLTAVNTPQVIGQLNA